MSSPLTKRLGLIGLLLISAPAAIAEQPTPESLIESGIKAKKHMGSPIIKKQKNKQHAMQQHQQFFQGRLQQQFGQHREALRQRGQQHRHHRQHSATILHKNLNRDNIQFKQKVNPQRFQQRQQLSQRFKQRHQHGISQAGDKAMAMAGQASGISSKNQRNQFGNNNRMQNWSMQRSQDHHQRRKQHRHHMGTGMNNQNGQSFRPGQGISRGRNVGMGASRQMGPNASARLHDQLRQQSQTMAEVNKQFD